MATIAHSAFYFADDKDVLDLLESSKKRLTQPVLRDFLVRRGVFASQAEDREQLVQLIAAMPLDWRDITDLITRSEIGDRAEKVTSVSLPTNATGEQVTAALSAVRSKRSSSRGEVFSVVARPDGGVDLRVEYSEMDRSRNRLAQRRRREGTVTLLPTDSGYAMRHEANSRLDGLAKDVIEALEAETKAPTEPRRIELRSVSSSDARTSFFVKMVEGISGMDLIDVTWVAVHRAGAAAVSSSDGPEDDEHGTDDPAMDSSASAMAGVVRDVVLRGDTLLTSKEYQTLRGEFYLCGIVWDSEEQKDDGVRVRFEAEFENRALCTGFKYHVRGVFARSQRGDEDFNKTPRACTPEEQQQYLLMLESAASAALDEVAGVAEATSVASSDGED